MLSQTKTSHNSVDEATFLLTFHCPVAVVKKCILFKERKEKVSFKEKLSCSSGFTRRREQIRPKSPLSNQGFNLFQSPQISTPCQLKHRLSLVAFEKYNSRATITIWYFWFFDYKIWYFYCFTPILTCSTRTNRVGTINRVHFTSSAEFTFLPLQSEHSAS